MPEPKGNDHVLRFAYCRSCGSKLYDGQIFRSFCTFCGKMIIDYQRITPEIFIDNVYIPIMFGSDFEIVRFNDKTNIKFSTHNTDSARDHISSFAGDKLKLTTRIKNTVFSDHLIDEFIVDLSFELTEHEIICICKEI